MKYIFPLSLLLLPSCGVYQSNFDCPPGKGIGCAPVGEVLELIVEKEEGEDLFVKDKGTALLLRNQEEKKTVSHQKISRIICESARDRGFFRKGLFHFR